METVARLVERLAFRAIALYVGLDPARWLSKPACTTNANGHAVTDSDGMAVGVA
ncbi:MAG TPA: hypothetical protein VM537_12005 [Anaerolineae bacterium]|nr:hypothetical protein [Anaerolineae bacterium]